MSVFDGMAQIITEALRPDAPIYILRPGEDRVAVDGVFVSDYRDLAATEFGAVEGRQSAVTLRTADAIGLEANTGRVEHLGVLYKVASVQPDAKGLTKMILKKHGLAPAESAD